MPHSQETINLATRVQRRRDFTAHLCGFVCGSAAITLALLTETAGFFGAAISVLIWGTALSFQHFFQVFRGAVTAEHVKKEEFRLAIRTLGSSKR